MASVKLVPNVNDAGLDNDCYFRCIEDVPKSIISLDANYCLLNKPAHVRMTGNFKITVEKLLLYWIKGVEVKDLKWIHQLDYATSGILCVGLNRKAAALASCAFASRTVQKQYLAVLQGRLDLSAYPILDTVPTEDYMDDEDNDSADGRSTKRKLSDTITSTKPKPPPPQAHDGTWQKEIMETNLKLCFDAFISWKQANADRADCADLADGNNGDNDLDVSHEQTFNTWRDSHPIEWNAVQNIIDLSYENFQRNAKYRKTLRKFLKSCGINVAVQDSIHTTLPELCAEKEKVKEEAVAAVTTEFEVTDETIASLKEKYRTTTSDPSPKIFRIKRENAPGGYRLVIRVPVAEIPGDFR